MKSNLKLFGISGNSYLYVNQKPQYGYKTRLYCEEFTTLSNKPSIQVEQVTVDFFAGPTETGMCYHFFFRNCILSTPFPLSDIKLKVRSILS